METSVEAAKRLWKDREVEVDSRYGRLMADSIDRAGEIFVNVKFSASYPDHVPIAIVLYTGFLLFQAQVELWESGKRLGRLDRGK